MTTLQARLAQAKEPTRELLKEAAEAVWGEYVLPDYSDWMDGIYTEEQMRWHVYLRMLDAEAWTSAVEMLVPADWPRRTYDPRGLLGLPATASVTANPCGQIVTIEADAAHPALALAIACLKARGL